MNIRWDNFQKVFSERKIETIIGAYYKVNPHLQGEADDVIEFAKENKLSLEQVKSLILSHSDLSLAGEFTFSAQELAEETGLVEENISVALDKLSLGLFIR